MAEFEQSIEDNGKRLNTIWATIVIMVPGCNSSSAVARSGVLATRQTADRYRKDTGDYVKGLARTRIEKRLNKASIPRDLTLPYGKFVVPAIGCQVVDKLFANRKTRDLEDVRRELHELHSTDSSVVPVLCYFEGIGILISHALRDLRTRLEEAEKVFGESMSHDEVTPFWKERGAKQIVYIKYMREKYCSSLADPRKSGEVVPVSKVAELVAEHREAMSPRSTLMDWINHAEYASVAESKSELCSAMAGIDKAVLARTSGSRAAAYVYEAVGVVLEDRDGLSFRQSILKDDPFPLLGGALG